MKAQIHAVIFDYGAVIARHPSKADFAPLAKLTGLSLEKAHALYWMDRNRYDEGLISAKEHWQDLGRRFGRAFPDDLVPQLIAAETNLWINLDPRIVEWPRNLRAAGVKTCILSNMQADLLAYMRANFAWLKEFDAAVFSCEIHKVKPDPEAYRACLDALGARAEETLFIDDRAENVKGAQGVGMRTMQFVSYEQMRDSVNEFDLPGLLL